MGEGGTRAEHPSDEQLIAFAGDELAGDMAVATAAHVERCAACAETVSRVRLVKHVVRASAAVAPPPALLARAKELFRATVHSQRASPGRLEPLRRIVAQLIFDSGAGWSPAVAGLRGIGDRHLTYVAEAVQVDLRLQPPAHQGETWRVQGQIEADERLPVTAVDMVPAGENTVVARSTTDEHGMFALAAPSGRYDMLVRLPHALQVLPGIELG